MEVFLNNHNAVIAAIIILGIIIAILVIVNSSIIQKLHHKAEQMDENLARKDNLLEAAKAEMVQKDNLIQTLSLEKNQITSELSFHKNQLVQLNEKYSLLEKHSGILQDSNRNLERSNQEFSEKNSLLLETNKSLQEKLNETVKSNVELVKEKENALTQIAGLKASLQASQELQHQIEENIKISHKQLEEQLTNLSSKFVKEGTSDLARKNSDELSNIVKPLREELDKFKEMINDNHAREEKRVGIFESQLKTMHESSVALSTQAQELTKALRTGSKSQGMWGELQLERVLESSGLIKDKDYRREVSVHPDNNDINVTARPDAVVYLPGNHCIIIDAKCSLTAYTDYINAENRDAKNVALKAHIESVRKHVKELKSKEYCEKYRNTLNSPYFVFMFVPLDGALQDALYNDSGLYEEAAASKIYLVSPASLNPALRVVANLWMLSEQSERVNDLIGAAQSIFDKFETIENKMAAVIDSSNKHHDNLLQLQNSLCTGRGNLKDKLLRFDKAGARLSKTLGGSTIENNLVELSTPVNYLESAVNDQYSGS